MNERFRVAVRREASIGEVTWERSGRGSSTSRRCSTPASRRTCGGNATGADRTETNAKTPGFLSCRAAVSPEPRRVAAPTNRPSFRLHSSFYKHLPLVSDPSIYPALRHHVGIAASESARTGAAGARCASAVVAPTGRARQPALNLQRIPPLSAFKSLGCGRGRSRGRSRGRGRSLSTGPIAASTGFCALASFLACFFARTRLERPPHCSSLGLETYSCHSASALSRRLV